MLFSSRFWLTLAALLCASSPALAFERQWHLGGGAGVVLPPGELSMGPAVGAHLAYGISDVFDLRLELAYSRHGHENEPTASGVSPQPSQNVLSGAAGIAYKLDVIDWIPYGGLLGGYLWSDMVESTTEPGPHPSLTLGFILGIDYGFSRSFGMGLAWRQDVLLNGDGTQGTLLLRAEYRWGW